MLPLGSHRRQLLRTALKARRCLQAPSRSAAPSLHATLPQYKVGSRWPAQPCIGRARDDRLVDVVGPVLALRRNVDKLGWRSHAVYEASAGRRRRATTEITGPRIAAWGATLIVTGCHRVIISPSQRGVLAKIAVPQDERRVLDTLPVHARRSAQLAPQNSRTPWPAKPQHCVRVYACVRTQGRQGPIRALPRSRVYRQAGRQATLSVCRPACFHACERRISTQHVERASDVRQ